MAGTDTYYFQGNGQASEPETLVMIDIEHQTAIPRAQRHQR